VEKVTGVSLPDMVSYMDSGNQSHAPYVSVIIPAYNQAGFLDSAVRSVLSQSYKNYEIIVVDDGSTDETALVAAKYHDCIRYIYQDNLGLAGARNTGISAARGELVSLLDSDDEWLPSYLSCMVALRELHPDAVVYTSAARCMDAAAVDLNQVVGYREIERGKLRWELLRANFIIPSTVTLCRSIINEAGLFDQKLRSLEDWDLWLRLLPEQSIICSADVLVRYRIHGSSLSTNITNMVHAYQTVVEKHFGVDDGVYTNWSAEKRRSYGGYYRYNLLMNVQRLNNWQANKMIQALQADPTLGDDVSFFYELALGNQPIGKRGDLEGVNFHANTSCLLGMLADVFSPENRVSHFANRRNVYGSAYQAIGLVAYNSGQFAEARKYFAAAVRMNPRLCTNKLVAGDFIKSFLKPLLT
jgi:glycosyltransferase involved in cell wall biosynthesis